jgi:hypothetical protein
MENLLTRAEKTHPRAHPPLSIFAIDSLIKATHSLISSWKKTRSIKVSAPSRYLSASALGHSSSATTIRPYASNLGSQLGSKLGVILDVRCRVQLESGKTETAIYSLHFNRRLRYLIQSLLNVISDSPHVLHLEVEARRTPRSGVWIDSVRLPAAYQQARYSAHWWTHRKRYGLCCESFSKECLNETAGLSCQIRLPQRKRSIGRCPKGGRDGQMLLECLRPSKTLWHNESARRCHRDLQGCAIETSKPQKEVVSDLVSSELGDVAQTKSRELYKVAYDVRGQQKVPGQRFGALSKVVKLRMDCQWSRPRMASS